MFHQTLVQLYFLICYLMNKIALTGFSKKKKKKLVYSFISLESSQRERERERELCSLCKEIVIFFLRVVDHCILRNRRLRNLKHHWINSVRKKSGLRIVSNTSLHQFCINHFAFIWFVSFTIFSLVHSHINLYIYIYILIFIFIFIILFTKS